jgi:ATP-dependent DNA helicase RecG
MDITTLLKRPESKTLEFKRDLSSPDGVLRTIVAFANSAGGTLVIGVTDSTRDVIGVPDIASVEERLASIVADGISPMLVPDVSVVPWRDRELLVVEVHPSPSRPHHLSSIGLEAGVLVRLGSTNRRADPELVAEISRQAVGRSYDETPMPGYDLTALDLGEAARFLGLSRPVRTEELETLHVLTGYVDRVVPTIGGLVMFGREDVREVALPDAFVMCALFEGTERLRFLDHMEIRAAAHASVEGAVTFVRRNTRRAAVITGATRHADRPDYPDEAVREAITNAVIHADYSRHGEPVRVAVLVDRLEVDSPGSLPHGLTIESIRKGISKPRNRVIAGAFRRAGLIEQWGTGIPRIVDACRAAGLPEPGFEEGANFFRVTLFNARSSRPAVDPVDDAILRSLRESGGMSTGELSSRIYRTPRATRSRLQSLVERGFVVEVGSAPNDPRRVYYVAEE